MTQPAPAVRILRSLKNWSRQQVILTLAVLLCVVGIAAWFMSAGRDSRLIGTWSMTHGSLSGPDGVIATRGRVARPGQWTFLVEGTGSRMHGGPPHGSPTFRWWTRGDRLYIKWGSNSTGSQAAQESIRDLFAVLQGRSEKYPVHEYKFEFEDDRTIRAEVEEELRLPQYEVIYLRRIGSRPSP